LLDLPVNAIGKGLFAQIVGRPMTTTINNPQQPAAQTGFIELL
jgi:hypothetical protein